MTTTKTLSGVIAAITTAIDDKGEPDSARSTALARFLLANGCDGLNVLGTTGEATSFALEDRNALRLHEVVIGCVGPLPGADAGILEPFGFVPMIAGDLVHFRLRIGRHFRGNGRRS